MVDPYSTPSVRPKSALSSTGTRGAPAGSTVSSNGAVSSTASTGAASRAGAGRSHAGGGGGGAADYLDTEIKEANWETLDDNDDGTSEAGLDGPELSRTRMPSRIDSSSEYAILVRSSSTATSGSGEDLGKSGQPVDRTFTQRDQNPHDDVDIYVICAQECEYTPRADPAAAAAAAGVNSTASATPHSSHHTPATATAAAAASPPMHSANSVSVSAASSGGGGGAGGHQKRYPSCKADWVDTLLRHIGSEKYSLLAYHQMWQIRIAVFVLSRQKHKVNTVEVSQEATGIAHVLGNKGAVAVSLSFRHTSFCFVNCHLAAHVVSAV